ncbi:MAG: Imm49 family immunity protein [Cellvibrionaceae bacterium]
MTLQLNNFPLDQLEKELIRANKVIDKFWPEAQANIMDDKLNHKLARSFSKLGYSLYQQEDPTASKENFALAAITSCREHHYKPTPTEEHETRNAWPFLSTLNLAACFGTENEIELLIQTEEIKYHHYPNEPTLNQFLADTITVMKSYLATGKVDKDTLTTLVETAQQNNRSKEEQTFVVPTIKGLNALLNNDVSNWQASIQDSLDGHLREVKTGDYRKDEKGFICMPGLALVKLGINKGWKNTIDSPYLPTQLLDA